MMESKKLWYSYYWKNIKKLQKAKINRLLGKPEYDFSVKTYAGKRVLSNKETNQLIYDRIMQNRPFMACRFGDTEIKYLAAVLEKRYIGIDHTKRRLEKLCYVPGFFPCEAKQGYHFFELMAESCGQADLLGVWHRMMEEYMIEAYAPGTELTTIGFLEPWNLVTETVQTEVKPWSAALKGKKVLVIHPFAESIRRQYEQKREKIFSNIFQADDILPEFELHVMKAVQTIGQEKDERFATWFAALDYMVEESRKFDFDVAVIGCGAYGFPLAAEIKKMGKAAIHLGGATQLMFGILGRRWEEAYPEFMKRVVNESWIRPSQEEKVRKTETIENGAYW